MCQEVSKTPDKVLHHRFGTNNKTVETNEKRRRFRTTTADLFRSVVVIYWELFHKPKTIQNIQNPEARLFGDDALHRGFQSVVAAVPTFCELPS